MNDGLSRSLLINTLWSFLGRFGYLAVGLISNIILVRLLSPREFGQVSIMMFFVIVATVLIESGLSGALIRKQNTTEVDYSTIFIFNLIVSLVLMLFLVSLSTYIANFYNDPELKNILIVSSFVLLINSVRITQITKLIKELKFKAKALYEFISISIGSIVAVLLALKGAGVWALVALQLTTAIVLTSLLWFFVGPLKSYKFSKDSFKQFYSFGINTTFASLLNITFDNIYQLVLGKYFSISSSGYFYQAKKLQEMPMGIISSVVLSVVYSSLAKNQNDPKSFNIIYRTVVRVFNILTGLICLIIIIYADSIISILYGPLWVKSVLYLQLLTIAGFFYLQEVYTNNIFRVYDKTKQILYLEIGKKLFQAITVYYGVITLSVENLLYGLIITNIINALLSIVFSKKIQNEPIYYEILELLKLLLIIILIIVSFFYIQKHYSINNFYLIVFMPAIFIVYFLALYIFHISNIFHDIKDLRRNLQK